MSKADLLRISGYEVAPGTQARGELDVAELSDGARVRLPLLLINGASPGPRLYLGAGIHGDEVDSVAILSRALAQVDPKSMAGQIVCVPVQHPLALHADHRLPLAQFLKSPLDQAPADAWTCFPGNAQGNFAEQLAAHLMGLITSCDYALDVHTPTRGGRYVPIAILPHPSLEHYGRTYDLAQALAPGWIMCSSSGMYVSDGILCVEATRAGIPCFTFELGEGGRLEPAIVETGANCILNAMQWLKMIDIARREPEKTHVMKEFLGLRAHRGGLLFTEVTLGDEVAQGQLLCRIVNVYGDEVERVTAPRDGLFVRSTTLSTVATGDRVATLGLV